MMRIGSSIKNSVKYYLPSIKKNFEQNFCSDGINDEIEKNQNSSSPIVIISPELNHYTVIDMMISEDFIKGEKNFLIYEFTHVKEYISISNYGRISTTTNLKIDNEYCFDFWIPPEYISIIQHMSKFLVTMRSTSKKHISKIYEDLLLHIRNSIRYKHNTN